MAGEVVHQLAHVVRRRRRSTVPPRAVQWRPAGGGPSTLPTIAVKVVRRPATKPRRRVTAFGPRLIDFRRRYADVRGRYRVFNAAEYRFYRSTTAPPEPGDTPFETNATLPHTTTATFADGTWYLACAFFDGVLEGPFLPQDEQGRAYRVLRISSGADAGEPPAGPTDWELTQETGGVVRVRGFLVDVTDTDKTADEWAIHYTTDGTTPAEDSPNVTADVGSGVLNILENDLPAQSHGTIVKVRLQTRRNDGTAGSPSWVYSAESTVATIAVDLVQPSAPLSADAWPGTMPDD